MERTITGRPQRNRRHSRRAWPPEDDLHHVRPAKRLFTPEIKRMLKDWLIRRRENPYPSRDEKKRLAYETGLTYTQICNWFANWRRKLKNSERQRAKKSWGHLIKHYNTNARGNVEQFSISSEDSIWVENERDDKFQTDDDDMDDDDDDDDDDGSFEGLNSSGTDGDKARSEDTMRYANAHELEHNNFYLVDPPNGETYVYNTNMEKDLNSNYLMDKTFSSNRAKYKQKMMEKYMRDMHGEQQNDAEVAQVMTDMLPAEETVAGGATELTKWLESAAKFTPNKNNYYISWNNRKNNDKQQHTPQPRHITLQSSNFTPPQQQQDNQTQHNYDTIHHKDELDAAEALANLAFNCRQRNILFKKTSQKCTNTFQNCLEINQYKLVQN